MARNMFAFIALLLAAYASASRTQTSNLDQSPTTSSAIALPGDPSDLMKLVAQENGLTSPHMKPWHLKAIYETFDNVGQPKERGTFEEWWSTPAKHKTVYASPHFNQIQYSTGDDIFWVGETKWPPSPLEMVPQYLVDPSFLPDSVASGKFTNADTKISGVSLKCLHPVDGQKNPLTSTPILFPAFCIGKDLPALRLEANRFEVFAIFDSIVRFQGQYVARQIQVRQQSKPILNIDLLTLETIDGINDADFTPPRDATLAPRRVAGNVIEGNRIEGASPVYPELAGNAGIQGVVVLEGTVTPTGMITDLRVLSGPSILQSAALDAVKTWRYKPFLLNGQPVAVTAEIDVYFRIPTRRY